jgi:hypothetical protein
LRKVRCDAHFPSCGACRRTAKFEGRDPASVVCNYQSKREPKTPKNPNAAKGKSKAALARAEAARRSDSAGSSTIKEEPVDAEAPEALSLAAAKRRKASKARSRKASREDNSDEGDEKTVLVAELETRMGESNRSGN